MFYVYAWYEPDGTCFYIGKGCGNRYKDRRLRNRYWKRVVAKHNGNVHVKILYGDLTESEAFEIEIRLIAEFKPRTNLTNGGEGASGAIVSLETREKHRQHMLGREYGPEHAENTRKVHLGAKRSAETKERIRQSKLGHTQSEETRRKRSESSKGREFSEEHRARLSDAAKKRVITQEIRDALKAGQQRRRIAEGTARQEAPQKPSRDWSDFLASLNKYGCATTTGNH